MGQKQYSRALLLAAMLPLSGVTGCDDGDKPVTPTKPTASAAPAPAKATSSAAEKPKTDEEVCKREEHKVWGKGANPRTGLTATILPDGRIALGVAFANRPHTLTFDRKGNGEMAKVALKEGTELTKTIPMSEGIRHLQRVTVAQGRLTFADYRDKYTSKRRRIACGPTNGDPPLLMFDGEPLIDTAHYEPPGKKSKPKAPKTATKATAKPSLTAAPAGKAKGKPKLRVAKGDDEPAPAAKPTTEAKRISPGTSQDPPEIQREIRDCRSFVSPDGKDVWAVGSELVGDSKDGGETKWTMRFFVAADGAKRRIPLHTVALSDTPKKVYTFETPVAHALASGTYVLAARYRGRMFAWLLKSDKTKQGSLHTYGGGYPTLPRIVADGDDRLLLTSQKVDLSHWKLRNIRLGARHTELLDALAQPKIGDEDDSLAEPTFARVGDVRWLSYQTDDRRGGRIMLVPVDEELAAVGRTVAVTPADDGVYESHVFALDDGRLLLVYIMHQKNKPAELISDVLRCQVTI